MSIQAVDDNGVTVVEIEAPWLVQESHGAPTD